MPDFLRKAARQTRKVCDPDETPVAALFTRPRKGDEVKRLGTPGGALSRVARFADEAAVRVRFLARRFFAMGAFQADSREFDRRRQTAARRVDSTRFRSGQSAEGPVSYESKTL